MREAFDVAQFGKWRRRLWPFHRSELRKLLPLLLMKFLISLNYCILTIMKDTLVVTSEGSGAEVIAVIKGWVILPAAMIIAVVYSKLSNVLNKKQLFYTVLGGFLTIIFLCGFLLYPNADILSPHQTADNLIELLGPKSVHWVAVFRNWIQTLLFITAELWGSVVILVMFWGFANDITTVSEAKRSYNIYIAAGDVAACLSGPIVYLITKKLNWLQFVHRNLMLFTIALIVGFAIMFIYWWINRYVLTDKNYYNPDEYKNSKKTKEKVTLRQGFRHLIKSRYLLGIAILVVAYGLAISSIEITWKATLKLTYPQPDDYQAFMSKAMSCVGFFAFFTSVFLGTNIMRRFGWCFSALLTPFLVGCTGIVFFALVLFKDSISPFTQLFGITPLFFIVLFGAFQNVISKVSKYSFFDPTKEMAYIPLDEEAKVKGKAAIDVVGSRLGKSGASWIQIGLIDLIGTGTIFSVTHLLLPIVVFVTITWILSVRSLSRKFDQKSSQLLENPV